LTDGDHVFFTDLKGVCAQLAWEVGARGTRLSVEQRRVVKAVDGVGDRFLQDEVAGSEGGKAKQHGCTSDG